MYNNSNEPRFGRTAFICPHCDIYASQEWYHVRESHDFNNDGIELWPNPHPSGEFSQHSNEPLSVPGYSISKCSHCGKISLWYKNTLNYPQGIYNIPQAVSNMPLDVLDIYNEARSVCQYSPRAAVALLRLSLQLLVPYVLNNPSGNLAKDIQRIIEKKNIPELVEIALESVRVLGNHSVHPGNINFNDNRETAFLLFYILNFVVEELITKPKQIEEIFNQLPKEEKEKINKRMSSRKEIKSHQEKN